jgi:group I intron endonuclease
MSSGIYKITNTVNGKCYIGSAVDLERRKQQHFSSSHNKPLRRAMKKYGKDNFKFDILVLCEPDNLTFVEQDQLDYWKKVKGWENMYNICPTAGSSLGVKLSEETKQLMSSQKKGDKNHNFGKQLSEEQRKLLSAINKGKYIGDNHPRYDQTIYNFVHKDGRVFQGTQYQLRTKEELNSGHLSNVILGKRNHTGGWSIVLPPEDA